MTQYSFSDVTFTFSHPTAGTYVMSGQSGFGQITISMATDRTVHDIPAGGDPMVSYVPGDNGTIAVEIVQTDFFHAFLLNWFNAVTTDAKLGNVGTFAAAVIKVRSLLDGSVHTAFGVSPTKVPDKAYGAQGQRLTWSLMAAEIING